MESFVASCLIEFHISYALEKMVIKSDPVWTNDDGSKRLKRSIGDRSSTVFLSVPGREEPINFYSFHSRPNAEVDRVLLSGVGYSEGRSSEQHCNLETTQFVLNAIGYWPDDEGTYQRFQVQVTSVMDLPGHGIELAVVADEEFMLIP